MSLKPIYESIPAGELRLNLDARDTAGNNIVGGTVAILDADGEVAAGDALDTVSLPAGSAVDPAVTIPYGIVADDKDDLIASGKITVYFTEGKFASDQWVATTPATELAANTALSYTSTAGNTLKLYPAASGDYILGFVTKAPSAEDPMMEFVLRISGAKA
jgi:hypothetical protein